MNGFWTLKPYYLVTWTLSLSVCRKTAFYGLGQFLLRFARQGFHEMAHAADLAAGLRNCRGLTCSPKPYKIAGHDPIIIGYSPADGN